MPISMPGPQGVTTDPESADHRKVKRQEATSKIGRGCSSPPPCQFGKGALKHRRNLFGQGPGAPCTILRILCIKRIENEVVEVNLDVYFVYSIVLHRIQ